MQDINELHENAFQAFQETSVQNPQYMNKIARLFGLEWEYDVAASKDQLVCRTQTNTELKGMVALQYKLKQKDEEMRDIYDRLARRSGFQPMQSSFVCEEETQEMKSTFSIRSTEDQQLIMMFRKSHDQPLLRSLVSVGQGR